MLVKRLIISLTLKGRGCVKYGGKPVKGGRLFRGDNSATKSHFNWRRPRVRRSAVRLLQPSLSYCQWLAADKTIVSFFSCEVNALNSLVCREVGRALCSKWLKKKRKLLLFFNLQVVTVVVALWAICVVSLSRNTRASCCSSIDAAFCFQSHLLWPLSTTGWKSAGSSGVDDEVGKKKAAQLSWTEHFREQQTNRMVPHHSSTSSQRDFISNVFIPFYL